MSVKDLLDAPRNIPLSTGINQHFVRMTKIFQRLTKFKNGRGQGYTFNSENRMVACRKRGPLQLTRRFLGG